MVSHSKRLTRRTTIAGLFLGTIYIVPHARGQSTSPYVRLYAPQGMSVEIPRNWVLLSTKTRMTLEAGAYAVLRLAQQDVVQSDLPIAANLFADDGKTTIALMNVKVYPTQDVTQQEALKLTDRELRDYDSYLRSELQAVAPHSGFQLLRWDGTRRLAVNGTVVLATQYLRSPVAGLNDPFLVSLARVHDASRSFTLTVSYVDRYAPLLARICQYITASLKRA